MATHRGGVDNLLAQERILARILVEETPIHFDIPRVGVAGGDYRGDYPEPSVGIIKGACIVG